MKAFERRPRCKPHRRHGPASETLNICRTAALGGHVARCEDCAYTTIAYNSCRNRHCPKCQGAAAKQWLAERQADLLAVPYYHIVFTLPAVIADITFNWPRLTWPALA